MLVCMLDLKKECGESKGFLLKKSCGQLVYILSVASKNLRRLVRLNDVNTTTVLGIPWGSDHITCPDSFCPRNAWDKDWHSREGQKYTPWMLIM